MQHRQLRDELLESGNAGNAHKSERSGSRQRKLMMMWIILFSSLCLMVDGQMLKISSETLAEAAEDADLYHEYNETMEFDYYNSMLINTVDEDGNPVPLGGEFPLEENEHFNKLPVNTQQSNIQVPTNVYNRDPDIVNGVFMSEALNDVFIDNFQKDPTLTWQYFGSATGFFRLYPGIQWIPDENGVVTFDARNRNCWVSMVTPTSSLTTATFCRILTYDLCLGIVLTRGYGQYIFIGNVSVEEGLHDLLAPDLTIASEWTYCETDIDPAHRKLSQLQAVVRYLTGKEPDLECDMQLLQQTLFDAVVTAPMEAYWTALMLNTSGMEDGVETAFLGTRSGLMRFQRYTGIEKRVAKSFLTSTDKENMFTLDHFPVWYRRAAEYPAGQFLYYMPRQDTR
ncbi:voltage-dependent calcium channel subunit alpha-2/delta-4-like isoform X1, partial [Lates japonicus]